MKFEELEKKLEKFPGATLEKGEGRYSVLKYGPDSITSKNIWTMWVWLKEKASGVQKIDVEVSQRINEADADLSIESEHDSENLTIEETSDTYDIFRKNIGKKVKITRVLFKEHTSTFTAVITDVKNDIIALFDVSGAERYVRVSDIIEFKFTR